MIEIRDVVDCVIERKFSTSACVKKQSVIRMKDILERVHSHTVYVHWEMYIHAALNFNTVTKT